MILGAFALALVAMVWFWRRDIIRPGSFTRRPGAEAPPAHAGVVLFLLALGCMLASALAGLGAMSAMGSTPGTPLTVREMGILTLAAAPAGVLATLVALHVARRLYALPRFRLRPTGLGTGLLVAVAVFPITVVVGSVSLWVATKLGSAPDDPIAHGTLDAIIDPGGGFWRWVLVAGAVIATPIYEEILFRGLAQSALVAVLPWRWVGVLTSTGLFTLVHVSGGIDGHSLPAIATIGLAMGIAYERTGKLAVPIAMHAAFNGANVLLAMAL